MAGAYPSFCSMKQLGVLLLPPPPPPINGMLVHRRVIPSNMSAVLIYTPGWRETMWKSNTFLIRLGLSFTNDGKR